MKSNIQYYESEFQKFQPFQHLTSRIQDMGNKSNYGAKLALKWTALVKQKLDNATYPVVHPIGQETFSLYVEFPTGVFEYAFDIDGASSLIKENKMKPVKVFPSSIIHSVDRGNINTDPNNIKPNHKNPIMILQSEYITDNKPYCINGNHRIFEAYQNNDTPIEIFVFKDLAFHSFFYDLLSKAIYFIEIDYKNVVTNRRDFIQNKQSAFAYEFD
ncbi:hypothetical protein ACIQ1H_07640 [Lysinibacillus sp. NPDC097279]|uniref:hypothetical protein n=1 Tax=Lysinibacillus sp. NPDC097279 TaxID=3364143 RepID=UPI00382C4A95